MARSAAFENEGAEHIFAIPGEKTLDVLEALRRSKILLVVTRREQAAGCKAATRGGADGTRARLLERIAGYPAERGSGRQSSDIPACSQVVCVWLPEFRR